MKSNLLNHSKFNDGLNTFDIYGKVIVALYLIDKAHLQIHIAVKKILVLTANPKNTTKLRLDEEVREIQEGLQRSRSRDQFEIISRWAIRPDDLRRALLDHEPQIVHFSGHGSGRDGLILEDNAGHTKSISGQSLARLFRLFQDKVECVLLNACYSDIQANAIHQYIDYVIGMSQTIGDRAAIEFAVGFYDGLGAGRSYVDAFEFGLAAIDLEGIPETAIPQLKQRSLQPSTLSLDSSNQSCIFISYKRDTEPDETVAHQLEQALSNQFIVAIDRHMKVGTEWMAWINTQLQKSDFLLVLLSEASVHSEMVQLEIEKARQFYQQQGHPKILPVRLAYRAPFHYPLNQYLDPLNWALWKDNQDTPRLIAELRRAIAGNNLNLNTEEQKAAVLQSTTKLVTLPAPQPMAQPRLLELPEGTMDLESQFYVERDSDHIALETIQRQGVTITIKGPRQMGKSSLLNRVMQTARLANKQVVFLDFQLFDTETLQDGDRFFQEFCFWLTEELALDDLVDEYWQRPISNSQRCTRYVGRHLLQSFQKPLVLAMDEVESIFDAPFRSDFFSMLRSWHNSRAIQPLWKQLDLALITSTEPYQLIADLNQSPFNVGQVVELSDFTPGQVHDLNQRHCMPFNLDQEEQLMHLVHGHPYLVRRALYLVASNRITVADLFAQATEDRGPFGDHLRYHLFRMYDKAELVLGLLQVIRRPTILDEHVFFRLRGAGLVQRQGQQVVPRCPLYAAYFQEHLHE